MGTDALDPDTDDDGICDGPNSVLPVCIGGPMLTRSVLVAMLL